MVATQHLGCSLDPDPVFLNFSDQAPGNHCLQPGYSADTVSTEGNNI